MSTPATIAEVKKAVEKAHGCTATHVATTPVREIFRGEAIWEGDVEVFDLEGCARATRCYAWEEPNDSGQRNVLSLLELPPVTSPEAAVKVAVAWMIRESQARTGAASSGAA